MNEKLSQQEIFAAVFEHYDDLNFIEKLNEMTYSRKLQLKSALKRKKDAQFRVRKIS